MTTRSWMQGPPKKILLATDLSARCDRAFDRAVTLATQWNAQLVAVHVMEEIPPSVLDETDRVPSWRRPADPRQLAETRIRADMRELSPEFTVVIESGDAADAILRTAEAHGCDLIVTGVARDTPRSFILGSTVERLARRSPAPLLIVRKRGRRPYSHVVVATDFSDSSRHALEAAACFFPQQVLTLFHAYDAPMSSIATDAAAVRKQFREAAEQEIAGFLKASDLSGWRGGTPEILLEYGEPDQLLYAYAKEKDVDLVALGSHGYSALFQMLIGSVAQSLITSLPCDVLVIREPRANAAR